MQHRRYRGALAAIVVLSILVSFGALPARASRTAPRSAVAVRGVWGDAPITMSDDSSADPFLTAYDRLGPNTVWRQAIGLPSVPAHLDGSGVTVAVLDTGVSRVPDLGNRVRARVDVTPEANGYDRYGHGTHMIGLVAGNGASSGGTWAGAAPGADVVSVKVAGWNGATDVSAVLAGLEWVAAHARQYGIRVVNLSFGTTSSQKYSLDPLNHAVERLWRAGIFVVVAAGNRGPNTGTVDKPGDDPFVVTVGAADLVGTVATGDDRVTPFSGRGPTSGDGLSKPDVVAPGVSLVSHRAPGSTLDALRPSARQGASYFRGTGTSQATAVVSGVAARMFEADPSLTPNEAKAALVGTTSRALAGHSGAGRGLIHAGAAVRAVQRGTFEGKPANTGVVRATGLGSIDSSRGASKVYADIDRDGEPKQVSGELDVLGNTWDAHAWASKLWSPSGWGSSPWAPLTQTSPGWSARPPPAVRWPGMAWDEELWTAKSWRDVSSDPSTWVAKSWRSWIWN